VDRSICLEVGISISDPLGKSGRLGSVGEDLDSLGCIFGLERVKLGLEGCDLALEGGLISLIVFILVLVVVVLIIVLLLLVVEITNFDSISSS
jgi:hypothetical protein